MIRPIDIDRAFRQELERWMRENAGQYRDAEALEARIPELYEAFLHRPSDALDGATPSEYLGQFDTPPRVIDALKVYAAAKMDPPEPLIARLRDAGEAAVAPLMELVQDDALDESLRVLAMSLLTAQGAGAAMDLCLKLIDARAERDPLADEAAELLYALGAQPVPAMLARLDRATDAALDTYLDLLCNFPGDERIYTSTMREFLRRTDRRAAYATYLARLNDSRAIEPLTRALDMEDIGYLDYLEIANAIDMLGGDAGERNREFPDDPDYESLRRLE